MPKDNYFEIPSDDNNENIAHQHFEKIEDKKYYTCWHIRIKRRLIPQWRKFKNPILIDECRRCGRLIAKQIVVYKDQRGVMQMRERRHYLPYEFIDHKTFKKYLQDEEEGEGYYKSGKSESMLAPKGVTFERVEKDENGVETFVNPGKWKNTRRP